MPPNKSGRSTNERAVQAHLKHRQLNTTVVPFKTRDEAIAALESGTIDAFGSDKLLLVGAGSRAKDPGALVILDDNLSFEAYGIALPRGDASLRLAVNTALSDIYASGAIAEIFGRWFSSFGKPPLLLEAVYIFGSIPD